MQLDDPGGDVPLERGGTGVVTGAVPPRLPHILGVFASHSARGVPRIIHPISQGVREEDWLFEFPQTGRYRVK